MQISDQIIAVIDDLAQRFGVAIDWGQDNVLPVVQRLCSNYIKYEIATSLVWLCIGLLFLIAGGMCVRAACKYNTVQDYDGVSVSALGTVICFLIASFIILPQILDIIRCCVIPELELLNLLKSLG